MLNQQIPQLDAQDLVGKEVAKEAPRLVTLEQVIDILSTAGKM